MKINLRKASVLQQELQDEITKLKSTSTSVSVSIYDEDIEAKFAKTLANYMEKHERIQLLISARTFLRTVVAECNVRTGIHKLLAEESSLEIKQVYFQQLSDESSRESPRVVQEMISTSKEAHKLPGGRTSFYSSFEVLPQDFIDSAKKTLQRIKSRRRVIRDKMAAINNLTEITIPEELLGAFKDLSIDEDQPIA